MNISLYAIGGTAVSYVLNSGEIDNKGSTSIRGSIREQDLVPTFKQSVEGVGSVTDTPPTAEAAWRDFSGTLGLYKQSDAPGDLTRPYLCDADNTRPGQLTAWLQWPDGATVAVDKNDNATPRWPFTVEALVNAPDATGFVAYDGISDHGYWKWNGTKFAFQRKVQAAPATQTTTRLPIGTKIYFDGTFPYPTVAATGTNLWTPLGAAGLTDISAAAAAGVGVANCIQTFVYFDILFAVATSGGNLTITPYRPNTPGVGNVLNSVTYAGLAACLGTIPGETTCLGAVACEGAVYIVTDRAVYAMQWNDLNNTILTTKLLELPRLTSPPCVWNGEVYIGAENRIVHIVPGQRGFDWRTPDAMGTLPVPFNGSIFGLTPTPDALFAQAIDAQVSFFTLGWALLRMDANGVWTCPYVSNSAATNFKLPGGPMIPVADATHPLGLAFLNVNTGTNYFESATVLPFPQAGRNPRTLATALRTQRAGPFRIVTPFYDLESETAQKQIERFRTSVQGASATYPIKVYYQTDYADEAGTDTFSSGSAKGTGLWHLCGYFASSSTAYAGATDASGNGYLWYEFDGATNYAGGAVGVLPTYPTYRRVRWCLELNGDTSGTTVPTIRSHAFHRLEYVTKAYERDISIRIRVGETQGKAQTPATTVTYPTSATVKTALKALKALNSGKTPCVYVDEWGDSQNVVITKFQDSLTSIQADGTPGEYVVSLSLMDLPLTGQS